MILELIRFFLVLVLKVAVAQILLVYYAKLGFSHLFLQEYREGMLFSDEPSLFILFWA